MATIVPNQGQYGTYSVLVWYLFSGRKLLMVHFHGPDKNKGTESVPKQKQWYIIMATMVPNQGQYGTSVQWQSINNGI